MASLRAAVGVHGDAGSVAAGATWNSATKVFVISAGITFLALSVLNPFTGGWAARVGKESALGMGLNARLDDKITLVNLRTPPEIARRVYENAHRNDYLPIENIDSIAAPTGPPVTAFESLMTKRSGVYTAWTAKRPDWLANTVLMTATNWEYMGLLKNWECHAAKHDLDWVVVAMDPKVHTFLGPDRSFLVRGEHIEKGAHSFRSEAFNALTCNKFSAVVEILASGRDVAFSDPDNVFAGDPFADTGFGSLGGMIQSDRYDFIYSVNFFTDPKDEAKAAEKERAHLSNGEEPFYDIKERRTMGNTGMYWIRSTPSSIEMLNFTVAECAGNTGWDDQTHLWQNVIKRIKGKRLPQPHYAGTDHCSQKQWDAPVAAAPVWSPTTPVPLRYCNLDIFKTMMQSLLHPARLARLCGPCNRGLPGRHTAGAGPATSAPCPRTPRPAPSTTARSARGGRRMAGGAGPAGAKHHPASRRQPLRGLRPSPEPHHPPI